MKKGSYTRLGGSCHGWFSYLSHSSSKVSKISTATTPATVAVTRTPTAAAVSATASRVHSAAQAPPSFTASSQCLLSTCDFLHRREEHAVAALQGLHSSSTAATAAAAAAAASLDSSGRGGDSDTSSDICVATTTTTTSSGIISTSASGCFAAFRLLRPSPLLLAPHASPHGSRAERLLQKHRVRSAGKSSPPLAAASNAMKTPQKERSRSSSSGSGSRLSASSSDALVSSSDSTTKNKKQKKAALVEPPSSKNVASVSSSLSSSDAAAAAVSRLQTLDLDEETYGEEDLEELDLSSDTAVAATTGNYDGDEAYQRNSRSSNNKNNTQRQQLAKKKKNKNEKQSTAQRQSTAPTAVAAAKHTAQLRQARERAAAAATAGEKRKKNDAKWDADNEDEDESEEATPLEAPHGGQRRPGGGVGMNIVLTNPFAAIHDHLSRSYRLEQLLPRPTARTSTSGKKSPGGGGSEERSASAVAGAEGSKKGGGKTAGKKDSSAAAATATATGGDATQYLLFGKQERKSGVFSFLRFDMNLDLYQKAWSYAPTLQKELHHIVSAVRGATAEYYTNSAASFADGKQQQQQQQDKSGAGKSLAVRPPSNNALMLAPGHTTIPGLTLFNNDLGLQSPLVRSSAPLLLAQRLLLFPDNQRHFHILAGRDKIPCDFFGDIDLGIARDAAEWATTHSGDSASGKGRGGRSSNSSSSAAAATTSSSSSSVLSSSSDASALTIAEGDEILLETLNYLEVRLPGIGFTDPFFLVLANNDPRNGKISFHIHARSMTFMRDRLSLSLADATRSLKSSSGGKGNSGQDGGAAALSPGSDIEELEYDDLTDLVNLIEQKDAAAAAGGGGGKGKSGKKGSSGSSASKSKASAGGKSSSGSAKAPRVIAFEDYRTVKLLAEEVNQSLGRPIFDTACYRNSGMLRCAYCSKVPSSSSSSSSSSSPVSSHSPVLVDAAGNPISSDVSASGGGLLMPYVRCKSGNPALQQKLDTMAAVIRTFSDPEIMELSFAHRFLETDVPAIRHIHASVKRFIDGHPQVMREMARAAAGVSSNTSSSKSGEGGSSAEKSSSKRATNSRSNNNNNNSSSEEAVSAYELQKIAAALREQILKVSTKHHFKLLKPRHVLGPLAAENQQEYDAYGNLVSPFMSERLKWSRYQQAVRRVHQLPAAAADNHDLWVRVGLALHNFSSEDHVLEEWVRFSLRCPQKYARDTCRRKWVQFERNPDALNWRRGYNYLTRTIWRHLGVNPQ